MDEQDQKLSVSTQLYCGPKVRCLVVNLVKAKMKNVLVLRQKGRTLRWPMAT